MTFYVTIAMVITYLFMCEDKQVIFTCGDSMFSHRSSPGISMVYKFITYSKVCIKWTLC